MFAKYIPISQSPPLESDKGVEWGIGKLHMLWPINSRDLGCRWTDLTDGTPHSAISCSLSLGIKVTLAGE